LNAYIFEEIDRDLPNVKIGMNSCKIKTCDLVTRDEIGPYRETWIDLFLGLSIKPLG